MARTPKLSPEAIPVAREIHRLAAERHMGQKALALAAGLNETYARDLFIGKSKNPQTEQLAQIAVVLGVSLDELRDPGRAGGDEQSDNVVEFSGVLPLRPSEFPLIKMWRILDQASRDQVFAKVTDLALRRMKSRKSNDI